VGCYADVINYQGKLLSAIPGLTMIAVGVGALVDNATLNAIASGAQYTYASPNWTALLAEIQQIVALACPEPPPQGLCGSSSCGFCACGTPQLPETPAYPNICTNTTIVGMLLHSPVYVFVLLCLFLFCFVCFVLLCLFLFWFVCFCLFCFVCFVCYFFIVYALLSC
jgi:hypothetical protein